MQSAVARFCRVLTVFGAIIALGVLALSAVVTPSATATSSPEQMNDSVKINLRGRVMPRCGISGMAGELTLRDGTGSNHRQSASLGFTINCNTPFIYNVSAGGGGAMQLEHASLGGAATGPRLPYLISFNIPTDDGGLLHAECNAEMLSAGSSGMGCTADSGNWIAINQRGKITLSLPGTDGLVAGRYADNIEITLSVKE